MPSKDTQVGCAMCDYLSGAPLLIPPTVSSHSRSHSHNFSPPADDDDDVYYPKGRRPREDEEGEESYEKQRQRPGRGG